jgi:tetratricopeptide (TPR) repeat protein
LDPSNEWYLSFLAKVYHQNGKTDLALEASKYLCNQYPDNVEHIYNLAQFQYSQARYDEAISSLNRIEKLLGKSEVLSLEKHSIYIQKKDFKAAEKELRALIDTNPVNMDYLVYLGDFYTQRGRLVEAFAQYQKVIAVDSINGMALFGLANYYNLQGDSTSFKSTIIKGFSSTRLDFDSKLQRLLPFLMNIEDEKNPLKKPDFQAIFDVLIATHPHETKVYLLYANYLNHIGNIPEALVAYENALAIEQNQEEIWQEFLFLSLNGHPKEIFLKSCKTAISIYPENPIINYLTGVSYSLNEDRKSAILYLNQVIKFSKDNERLVSQAYGFLGDLYYQEGDSARSFESYQSSLAIDENQVNVLNNYAYYLSLEETNLDKAEKMISKVIEMEPQNPTYLDTYAWVLFKRERYFEALFIIEQAISFDKEQGGVLFEHYGDILFKNGNVEKAVEFWIKASETNAEGLSDNLLLKIT